MIPELKQALEIKAEAIRRAKTWKIDELVRMILKELVSGTNPEAQLEDLTLSATHGAGQNGTKVILQGVGEVYSATSYGEHISVFKMGSWVIKLEKRGKDVKKRNAIQERAAERDKATKIRTFFSPVREE